MSTLPLVQVVDVSQNSDVDATAAAAIEDAVGANNSRARIMEEAAKLFLHTRDPSILMRTLAGCGHFAT